MDGLINKTSSMGMNNNDGNLIIIKRRHGGNTAPVANPVARTRFRKGPRFVELGTLSINGVLGGHKEGLAFRGLWSGRGKRSTDQNL